MKKYLTKNLRNVFLMLTVIGLSVLSCKEKTEKAKLVIAARGGLHVEAINSVKEDFEKEYEVQIEILGLEGSSLKQKISLDSQNPKSSFDLIMIDDPWMPEFAAAKILASLSELGIEADNDFVKASLDLGKYPYRTGKLYALPFAGNVQLLFYNQELFKKHNFKAPRSWQDVLNISQTVAQQDKKLGYVIRGQQGNPIVSDFLPVLWAFGGSIFDKEQKVNLNSEQAKRALQFYLQLLATGENYEKSDLVNSVIAGDASMSLGWPSWYIARENSQAGYAPIPSQEKSSSKSYPTGMIGNWMMGIPAHSQNKKLAAKFLTFITASATQKKMALHGGVPTRSSVYLDKTLSERYKHFPTQLKALENSVARERTAKWSQIENALGAELSAVVSKGKKINEALQAASQQIEEIMKK